MVQITLSDLLSQETKRDPAAFYAQFRGREQLSYVTNFGGMGGAWIAMNYDDAMAILKDSRFLRSTQNTPSPEKRRSTPQEILSLVKMFAWRRDMLTTDPPDHTRLRGLASKAFTPRMVEQLRQRIRQITDELLDAVQDQGWMDLINDFAYPLPITVICEMLGIPVADRPQFRIWTQALLNMSEKSEQGAKAVATLRYIKTLLAKKREYPGNDLISNLVQVEENGDTLSEQELISTIFLLIVAGHETTVNLIGNGMLALLEHPEQLRLLQQDLSLVPSAVEELLRYTPPVTVTIRWASEDVSMHGKMIREGEMVVVSLVGADTDPQRFTDPDVLDVTRQEHEHLAFGKGIHYCLGAPLARLEGQIAFSTLLHRLPNLHLASGPEQLAWNRAFSVRGLTSLLVEF